MPPPVPPRQAAVSLSLLDYLGLFFLHLFLFLAYSRISEVALPDLHLPLVSAWCALAAVVLAGQLKQAVVSKWGLLMGLLSGWLFAGIPFSVWPGGSAARFQTVWMKAVVLFVVVAGLLRTVRHCRQTMFAIGFSVLVITLMCIYYLGKLPVDKSGHRLMLPGGTLENSNDLAQILLMGLPFWGFIASLKGNVARKLFGVVAVGAILFVILQTGSRSALLTLIVAGVALFLTSSLINRLRLAAAMVALGIVFVAFVPGALRQRYLTLVSSESVAGGELEEAEESAAMRKHVLRQSVEQTLRHPLLGVGMGNFQVAAARASKEAKERAAWLETHNSYTQISSEAGLPALFFFVALIWLSLRKPYQAYKSASRFPQLQTTALVGFWLSMTVLNFAVTILFTSVAYSVFLPTLAGLSSAYVRAAQREIALAEASAQAAAKASPVPEPARAGRFAPVRRRG